jgi:hypothetical protein
MGEAGRGAVMSEFSSNAVGERLERLFLNHLNAGPRLAARGVA